MILVSVFVSFCTSTNTLYLCFMSALWLRKNASKTYTRMEWIGFCCSVCMHDLLLYGSLRERRSGEEIHVEVVHSYYNTMDCLCAWVNPFTIAKSRRMLNYGDFSLIMCLHPEFILSAFESFFTVPFKGGIISSFLNSNKPIGPDAPWKLCFWLFAHLQIT